MIRTYQWSQSSQPGAAHDIPRAGPYFFFFWFLFYRSLVEFCNGWVLLGDTATPSVKEISIDRERGRTGGGCGAVFIRGGRSVVGGAVSELVGSNWSNGRIEKEVDIIIIRKCCSGRSFVGQSRVIS